MAYPVGDEICQRPLAAVIAEQAAVIAEDIGGDVLQLPQRRDLIRAVIGEMTLALVSAGDRYRSPSRSLNHPETAPVELELPFPSGDARLARGRLFLLKNVCG